MKHSFWDNYSTIKSPVHKISPGIKLITAFLLLMILAVLPYRYLLWGAPAITVFLLISTLISKIPLIPTLRRILIILPIVVPVILINSVFMTNGGKNSLVLAIRSFLSIFTLIILISVTKFSDILRTLRSWHFPKILLMILSFMYRYFFLLTDELEKMVRATKMRWGKRSGLKVIKVYGQILGILFIKSYIRAERVYHAMVMRGFNGNGDII
ncbi:MAG: energy-coupling factor transporter transmembrane component T [Acidobacteriota bacterium]